MPHAVYAWSMGILVRVSKMDQNTLSVEGILAAAVEIASPEERRNYVQRACAGDDVLREKIERMLANYFRGGDFLERSPALPVTTDDPCKVESNGTRIGLYKLLEQIGEGGMGIVYVAEQQQPIRRTVAFKIVKPGMDSKQVIARFQAERQALALMDHPNIAKVLDAGTTDAGRPYFVMELVRGIPITEYCDQARLTVQQRLELFVQVCRAVQHAHTKGVIHRDLKPSNVLVTSHDGVPVPLVIDFGVAKALGQRLTEQTLHTGFAQMIGTPLYMSPEQAEYNQLGVDTRSDIYSLGVLLYELLTGVTPFDRERLRTVGYDEMRRILREEEPPRPSARLTTLGAALSTTSQRRGIDPRKLTQTLHGELDWIVLKSLEKDRKRRYETASDFAADIERYLKDEQVAACPPSAGYRMRKFARRNRQSLTTAGIISMALVVATTVSAWQAVVARDAQHQAEADRDRAQSAERQATTDQDRAKTAERRAATDAAIARAVNDFLQRDLLGQVGNLPQETIDGHDANQNLTVKEALDRAAARIGERFRDQPLVEAAIRTTIGDAYTSVNTYRPAVAQIEQAVALRQTNLGNNHPETLSTKGKLASLYLRVGRLRDAFQILEKVVEEQEHLFGSDHSTTLDSMSTLAVAYEYAGQWDRAIALAKHVLGKRMAILGPTHLDIVGDMRLLAAVYFQAGLLPESLALYEQTLAISNDKLGNNRVYIIYVMKGYARALQSAGKLEEADCMLLKALELSRTLGDLRRSEMEVARVQKILGINLLLQGRYTDAEPVARQALAVLEKYTPNDWSVFHAMSLVGGALSGQKRYVEAEPFLVKGYRGLKQNKATMEAGFHVWLNLAGDRLLSYYEATNQLEQARTLREELRTSSGSK